MRSTGLGDSAVDERGSQAKGRGEAGQPGDTDNRQGSRVVAFGRLDGEYPCPARPIDNLVVWPSIQARRRIKLQAWNLR